VGRIEPWKPIRLEETDSTNRYLADLARSGAAHGTVVLAERQTTGRGRLGRRWVDAPGGSVLCSVLLRLRLPLERWHLAGWLVALAAADAAVAVAGAEPTCKWPNDLVIGTRKVAGVLAEVVQVPGSRHADQPGALVVGIGVNCNWPEGWPPANDPDAEAIAATATSLDREAGRPVDRDAVVARLLEGTARRAAILVAADTGGDRGEIEHAARELGSEYRRRCSTIGAQVSVELAGEQFVGRALDVNDEGHLLVDVGSCLRTVTAGDVVHLR
jgi:BirA family biotin operon repressor/biotin-[acetyl-CoA-carboxylase] ligase